MTDCAQGQAASAGTAIPSPLSIRPRPRAAAPADSGRAAARAVLDGALRDVELTAAERRFVARISQWDKRTAMLVASLIEHARQAGRAEAVADARAFAELAAVPSGGPAPVAPVTPVSPVSPAAPTPAALARLDQRTSYRRRTAVAS